jgi:hypothetical protein
VTLRQALGGDARRIHELVDELLHGEDSVIVLIDGRRAIGFAEGFGLSLVDRGSASGRPGDIADGNRGLPSGPVLRLASKAGTSNSG